MEVDIVNGKPFTFFTCWLKQYYHHIIKYVPQCTCVYHIDGCGQVCGELGDVMSWSTGSRWAADTLGVMEDTRGDRYRGNRHGCKNYISGLPQAIRRPYGILISSGILSWITPNTDDYTSVPTGTWQGTLWFATNDCNDADFGLLFFHWVLYKYNRGTLMILWPLPMCWFGYGTAQ